jgi:predicted ester cyclase
MKFIGIHTGSFLGYEPTNKEIFWSGAALFKFNGSHISELWVLGDLKGLETQLKYSL